MAWVPPRASRSSTRSGFIRATDPRFTTAGRTGRTVSNRWFAGKSALRQLIFRRLAQLLTDRRSGLRMTHVSTVLTRADN